MVVVPQLAWPILFGENHLPATKALVDHDQPSITFRHPNMQFTIPCSLDNPLNGFTSTTASASPHAPGTGSGDSRKPHVGVTCLLTKTPLFGQPTTLYSLSSWDFKAPSVCCDWRASIFSTVSKSWVDFSTGNRRQLLPSLENPLTWSTPLSVTSRKTCVATLVLRLTSQT